MLETHREFLAYWTRKPIVATLHSMVEEGETPKDLPLGVAAPSGPDPSVNPSAAPAPPPKPVNKLHEWAAAILIMVVLTAILSFFLSFMRGASF